jgi:metal-dependent amidase/aminoacylase/carboxypeptidase family protein
MREERTAALAAQRLETAGFEVMMDVGKASVVSLLRNGLLRNGEGPTVMLRADMDALPVQEQTGSITRARPKQSCMRAVTTVTSLGS